MILRHLTSEERIAIRDLFEKVGAKELIAVVAGLVANNAPDVGEASDLRIALNKLGVKCAKALGEKDGERVS